MPAQRLRVVLRAFPCPPCLASVCPVSSALEPPKPAPIVALCTTPVKWPSIRWCRRRRRRRPYCHRCCCCCIGILCRLRIKAFAVKNPQPLLVSFPVFSSAFVSSSRTFLPGCLVDWSSPRQDSGVLQVDVAAFPGIFSEGSDHPEREFSSLACLPACQPDRQRDGQSADKPSGNGQKVKVLKVAHLPTTATSESAGTGAARQQE